MTDRAVVTPLQGAPRAEQMFPTLTEAQLQRIAARGRIHVKEPGGILFAEGDQNFPFFAVRSGRVEILQTTKEPETIVAVHGPGQFTGEVNMLSGRASLAAARMQEGGEVIELDRDALLALIQTDSEISEILMRAFILRRVVLFARGLGDAVLIGSPFSPGTLRIPEFPTPHGQ